MGLFHISQHINFVSNLLNIVVISQDYALCITSNPLFGRIAQTIKKDCGGTNLAKVLDVSFHSRQCCQHLKLELLQIEEKLKNEPSYFIQILDEPDLSKSIIQDVKTGAGTSHSQICPPPFTVLDELFAFVKTQFPQL